jgi:phasin family protein
MPSTRSNDTAAQNAQRLTDQVAQMFSFSGERGEELSRRSSQSLEALTGASTVVARGMQDLTREWVSLLQEQTQRNIEGFAALARCRTLPELLSAQAELVQGSVQRTVEGTRRMAETSARLVTEASQMGTAVVKKDQRAA